jgi:hypothetical protein
LRNFFIIIHHVTIVIDVSENFIQLNFVNILIRITKIIRLFAD